MIKRTISTVFMLSTLVIASIFAVNTVNAETGENFSYNIMEDGTANIIECLENKEEVTIPTKLAGKTVTAISGGAFDECTEMDTIKIPESVESIDEHTFENSEDLTIQCFQDSYAHKFAEENNIKSQMFVDNISVRTKSVVVPVGNTKSLYATVTPNNAFNKDKKWISGNTRVAIVNSRGVVTARRKGTVNIYVKSTDGSMKQAQCRITVKQPVQKIKLNHKKITLKRGNKKILSATVLPKYANNKKIKWVTTKKTVAYVNSKGVVTAKSKGKANIYAKSTDGSKKYAKCAVKVTQPVKKVKMNKSSVSVTIGKTCRIGAKVKPSNANNKALKWKSSNPKVAAVDSKGNITTFSLGKATIYAISKDNKKITDKCTVTVTPVINLSPYEQDILARSLYREAGSTSYMCQLYVCSATINLWQSQYSHMSLASMLTSYNIFETAYTLNSVSEWQKNSVMNVVKDVMNGGKIPNIKYFRNCYYHSFGTPVANIDNVYFSM